MKKNIYMKTIKIVWSLFAACLFFACDDMSSIHQEYLDAGERIYIGIADSLTVAPGNQRAKLSWKLDADPKLKDCVVSWSATDSVVYPLERVTNDPQWMEVEVNNLPEGSLVFTVYTRDIYGNNSLKREKSQQIYGDRYIENQLPRKIASMDVFNPDKMTMMWNTMDNSVGVNMHYTTRAGKKVDLFIEPDQTEVQLTDFVLGGEFSYETLYLPSATCIDTFITASKVDRFPNIYILDRSNWTATASSDKAGEDGGTAQVLLDGNSETYWHSQWSPDAPLPHWILIDMKQEYEISVVEVFKRLSNTDCKKLDILVSMDGVNFDKIGTIEYEKTQLPNAKDITLDTSVRAKYLKLLITESWRTPYASLSEVKVLGKPI